MGDKMDRIHLTDKFKQLQIGSLQTMPSFVGDCILFINANPVAVHVVAGNGVLSVTPFPLFPMGLIGFQVPGSDPTEKYKYRPYSRIEDNTVVHKRRRKVEFHWVPQFVSKKKDSLLIL